MSDHRGSMKAGAHALSPNHSPQRLKSPFFQTLSCIPGELELHVAAWRVMICSWWMRVGSSIKSGQGTREVGVVVQWQWAQPWLSDCPPTATAAQDTAAGYEPRSARQGSGLFTVDWSHTRSSPAQTSSGTRLHSLCNRLKDEALRITAESLGQILWTEHYLGIF